MDDLIYRETARRAYEKSLENDNHKIAGASAIHMQEHRHMLHILDKIPAVDAVEVVRCKDCEYWEFDESEYRENPYYKSYCEVWGHQGDGPDGYCSAAKRRADNAPD